MIEFREYDYRDEDLDCDCCVCDCGTKDFVIDFGRYKTTVCQECLKFIIEKIKKSKEVKFCRNCKHAKLTGGYVNYLKCEINDIEIIRADRACNKFKEKN